MKRIVYTMIAAVLFSLCTTSCKTSEENYKAAYDVALRKQEGGAGRDVSAFIRREQNLAQYKKIDGDSVRIVTETVRMVDGNDADIRNYGVVVGDFKQVFNARSYAKRINDAESDTPSYVVINAEKRYYVVYRGFDTKEEAAQLLRDKKYKIGTQLSEPWILEQKK